MAGNSKEEEKKERRLVTLDPVNVKWAKKMGLSLSTFLNNFLTDCRQAVESGETIKDKLAILETKNIRIARK